MRRTLVILAAAGTFALPPASLAVGAAALADVNPGADCALGSATTITDLDPTQTANVRVIMAVGQHLGVPAQGLVVALMAAMQESGLRNLDYGDRDSLGLFQQRPSAGWGNPTQLLNPAYAAAAFYGGTGSPTHNPGLLDVPHWQDLPPGVAAQAVQHSAFPDTYARWERPARTWLGQLGSGQLGYPAEATSPCPAPGAGVGPSAVIAAAAKWLGTPYSFGGGDLDGPTLGIGNGAHTVGFDCSGLTRYAFAQVGVSLPRTAAEQWHIPGQRISSMAALAPGDLVFFATNVHDQATIHHVAIALGGDAMLQAPRTGEFVQVTRGISQSAYWAPQFVGGLRILR